MRQLLKITSIFSLALLFMVGTAFAQSGDNTGKITQDGDDSRAIIDQVGNSQFAKIDQSVSFGAGNEATVDQYNGDDNAAVVNQSEEAYADIDQQGADNSVNLSQGGLNEARVIQEGDGNSLSGYDGGTTARQLNGTGIFSGQKNDLFLRQEGANNSTGLLQQGGDAGVVLDGDNNTLGVRQKAPSGDKQDATVNVTGSSNNIDVFQGVQFGLGSGNNQATVLIENGSSNFVDVDQRTPNGTARVEIDGASNVSRIDQTTP